MRPRGLALTALLLAAAPLAAQPPKTPPTTPPAPPAAPAAQPADPLDGYLTAGSRRWRGPVPQRRAQAHREGPDHRNGKTLHRLHQISRVSSGGTTQNLALLQMTEEGKKDFAQHFVCSGAFLYEFRPADKEIVAHEIPKPKAARFPTTTSCPSSSA